MFFAFYMSSFIGLAMSAVLTYVESGLTPDYLTQAGKAYALAMQVGFLCVILFRPLLLVLMRAMVASPVPVEQSQAVD